MWKKFLLWLRSLFFPRRKSRPPTATIHVTNASSTLLSYGLNSGCNPPFHGLEPLASFAVTPFVFIYNLNEESFQIVGHPVFGILKIQGRLPGERYCFVTSMPEYVHPTKINLESNEIQATNLSGIRAVVDLINPDNWTNDLDYEVPKECIFSVGNDLSKKGVFFSLSNPPAEADIIAAERRLEKASNG